MSFWGEKLQESKYNLTDEQLRPYFSLPNVLDGLHSVRTSIFYLHRTTVVCNRKCSAKRLLTVPPATNANRGQGGCASLQCTVLSYSPWNMQHVIPLCKCRPCISPMSIQ